MKTYYMHTMDGQPAYFDGRSIWFWGNHRQKTCRLCDSLAELRQQQEKAKYWWQNEMRTPFLRSLDYIRVAVPA